MHLPLSPASARLARQHVRDVTGTAEDPRVALVVTELVTNAVVHGQGGPTLAVTATPSSVRVEVHDDGPGLPRLRPFSEEPTTSGRGLALVDMVADAWGVVADPGDGKTVWAEISRS